MDLLSYCGDADTAIVVDSGNFLVRAKVNGVACYIVILETCRNCDVFCPFLFTTKKTHS